VHVPTDELDVLLRGQGRSVILRYDEYRALLEAARGQDVAPDAKAPEDVVRLSGDGTFDLTDERAVRFEIAEPTWNAELPSGLATATERLTQPRDR